MHEWYTRKLEIQLKMKNKTMKDDAGMKNSCINLTARLPKNNSRLEQDLKKTAKFHAE